VTSGQPSRRLESWPPNVVLRLCLAHDGMVFGIIFAGVAGIMVFISLDELLPAAKKYDGTHLPIYGVIAGMAVMAVSLLMFI